MQQRFTLVLVALTILFTAGTIDLNDLFNYANQDNPPYIQKDNTPADNPITDAGATLGRVLFYDTNLSANHAVSCASCHQQQFAFGDIGTTSTGLDGGQTVRHSMRLVNARFANEVQFFWDERAGSLEEQTTMPIQDHIEMGFSGEDGDPNMDSLITRLGQIDYYEELFTFAFGDATITEARMQMALAQFVRSIQSFDARFDEGLAMAPNINAPFPNFTDTENLGKQLYLAPPNAGGAGCQGCHRAPEFDIDPNSLNNGVVGVVGSPGEVDLTITRSPSLRDVFNADGTLNGPLMHTGNFVTMMQVINHYNEVPINPANTNLDPRLAGGPGPGNQELNLTDEEKLALIAFLQTLSGNDIYTNEQWSDPFEPDGTLEIIPFCQEITTNIAVEVCAGATYEGYGASGLYTDVFTDANGCDSTRILDLTVAAPIETILDAEICQGDTLEGYFESGLYTDVFVAENGCDSTRTLALFVLPSSDPDCLVNSIEEVTDLGLTWGPNPVSDAIFLNWNYPEDWTLRVFDATGRVLLELQLDNWTQQLDIPFGNYQAGVYFLVGLDAEGLPLVSERILKVD
ncbi:MAG: cytochrome c peroxidase [Bacteroidota bacterium]